MTAARRSLPLLAALIVLAGLAPAAAGKRHRVRCSSGVTLFREGKLRIFGVPYRATMEQGYEEYACLGGRGRPQGIGLLAYLDVGGADTPAFAFEGGRYLGSYHTTDGEGGPSAWYDVVDLRTGRSVAYENATYEDGPPAFRVASNGALVTIDEDEVGVLAPGSRRSRTLSTPGVKATDLALTGATVYWTEHPDGAPAVARSATLPGVTGDAEARLLEPVNPRDRGRGCRSARGTTLASSPSVRVYRRGGRRACRIGGRSLRLPARGPAPRIVADRWLLVRGPGSPATTLRAIDMRKGGRTTTAGSAGGPGLGAATMLANGSTAWLEAGGRVLAQRPGAAAPSVLAPADPAPSALAASRYTVYWTAGGAPHVARPPR